MEQFANELEKVAAALDASDTPAPTTDIPTTWDEGTKGTDVDWTDYEISYEHVHFYQNAVYRNGMWMHPTVFFSAVTGGWGDTNTSLPTRLMNAVNGEEHWKIHGNIVSNGAGSGAALLTRLEWTPLPEPIPVTRTLAGDGVAAVSVDEAAAALAPPTS